MIDGGPGAEPRCKLLAWLVTDDRAELIRDIRKLARTHGLEPQIASIAWNGCKVEPRPVVHTTHPTYGYLIHLRRRRVIWAPEFYKFPEWAAGADLMFADAAGWNRPIHFARKVGGHACVSDAARWATEYSVRRLVFAHIGRPTIRAMDAGKQPTFGEFGREGTIYQV